MNRQNLRKLLLMISMLLFPITIWYMSPYLIIQGAMEGIVSGSFIVSAWFYLFWENFLWLALSYGRYAGMSVFGK